MALHLVAYSSNRSRVLQLGDRFFERYFTANGYQISRILPLLARFTHPYFVHVKAMSYYACHDRNVLVGLLIATIHIGPRSRPLFTSVLSIQLAAAAYQVFRNCLWPLSRRTGTQHPNLLCLFSGGSSMDREPTTGMHIYFLSCANTHAIIGLHFISRAIAHRDFAGYSCPISTR